MSNGYRINERNIGNSTLESAPKKRGEKLTINEYIIVNKILSKVYDCMSEDEILQKFTDGGNFVLALTGEQMFDLFEAKRKLKSEFINQKIVKL